MAAETKQTVQPRARGDKSWIMGNPVPPAALEDLEEEYSAGSISQSRAALLWHNGRFGSGKKCHESS